MSGNLTHLLTSIFGNGTTTVAMSIRPQAGAMGSDTILMDVITRLHGICIV